MSISNIFVFVLLRQEKKPSLPMCGKLGEFATRTSIKDSKGSSLQGIKIPAERKPRQTQSSRSHSRP